MRFVCVCVWVLVQVIYDGYMYIFAGNSNGYYSDLHRLHIGSAARPFARMESNRMADDDDDDDDDR